MNLRLETNKGLQKNWFTSTSIGLSDWEKKAGRKEEGRIKIDWSKPGEDKGDDE